MTEIMRIEEVSIRLLEETNALNLTLCPRITDAARIDRRHVKARLR